MLLSIYRVSGFLDHSLRDFGLLLYKFSHFKALITYLGFIYHICLDCTTLTSRAVCFLLSMLLLEPSLVDFRSIGDLVDVWK